MLTGVPEVYRKIRFRRHFKWGGIKIPYDAIERIYDLDAPLDAILVSAGDEAGIERAAPFCKGRIHDPKARTESAIYIIKVVDQPICKIGYSSYPTKRLLELQQATWCKLRLAAAFFIINGKPAYLEGDIKEALKKQRRLVRGEWFRGEVEEIAKVVIDLARENEYRLCGSDVFLDNWTARVASIANARDDHRKSQGDRSRAYNASLDARIAAAFAQA